MIIKCTDPICIFLQLYARKLPKGQRLKICAIPAAFSCLSNSPVFSLNQNKAFCGPFFNFHRKQLTKPLPILQYCLITRRTMAAFKCLAFESIIKQRRSVTEAPRHFRTTRHLPNLEPIRLLFGMQNYRWNGLLEWSEDLGRFRISFFR